MTTKVRQHSDAQIITFMKQLPGGNVPQYAKLLNTTSIRLNKLLSEDHNRTFARSGIVCAPEKGAMPAWSGRKTQRGCLRATDVDRLRREGALPPFISKLLEGVHERFKDDALNFLREALEQTSNHTSFVAQMTAYMEQDHHRTDQLIATESQVNRLESEIGRLDRILDRVQALGGRLGEVSERAEAFLTDARQPAAANTSADAAAEKTPENVG